MNELSKTNFSILTEIEKQSRLWQAEQSKIKVLIWSKGQKNRISFWLRSFDKKEQQLILSGDTRIFTPQTHILGSFELNGVSYFFKSKVIFQGIDDLKIDTSLEFYKSERRNSFRLLTYPLFQVYLETTIEGSYKGSNVVSFQSKMSQTGLFKSFLKLVDGETGRENNKNSVKLRVQDISVSGLSTHIGEAELPFFNLDTPLKNIKIVFTDEVIDIAEAKIVYIVNLIQSKDKKVRQYKMGLNFVTNESIDSVLSQKINKMLRENDSNKEFEDFIN